MLGHPPWSEEEIINAYFRDFLAVNEALLHHPGHQYSSAVLLINKGVEVFDRATEELSEIVSAYRQALDKETMPTRRTQSTFDHLDTCLRMRIVSFGGCDESRGLQQACQTDNP